ncbi:Cationic amino acid transporter 3 [Carex littledalei]|uniref:Cationic amino acid transporter 3 n=1 Tax=Carex littledalei TaxID=544730 RepID=A0A833QRC7_9POAL|nr:Cationic amino acid transporter 3 [Carex littledalei]
MAHSHLTCHALFSYLQYLVCIIGGLLLLCASVILSCIDQYKGQSNFGRSGGFLCPFVPWLPILCIVINIYLLINLGLGTWLRVSVWLLAGILIYIFYGYAHSKAAKVEKAYMRIGSPTHGGTT